MSNNKSYRAWSESDRLAALAKYHILDTPPEAVFDDVVKLTSELLDAPIAAVNLIAQGRQWFKSEIGLGVREMPLDDSICKIALFEQDRMIVPDTLDDSRFNCNPLVTGTPGLRFYAGELLKTPDGLPLGTLCVLDLKPRPEGLTQQQQFALKTLAQQIIAQMELRKLVHEQNALLLEHRHTEETLRREQARSLQLLHGMEEGFVLLDTDYRIRQISPGGLKMDGRTEAELIGMTHWDAWPGSEQLPVAEAIKQVMTQRVPANVEVLYVYPDGRKFWLDLRAFPTEGGVALFYRNISERKEAEERSRQTAQRLEFTLQAAKIGDWDLDLEKDTSYRSLRHDQCFGYAEPIPNWGFETFIQHVHPEDRDAVAKQFEASLAEMKDWHFECRVVWPDETIHWIGAHGSIYHADSKPTRMSGIVYDITNRKKTEEALRESERRSAEAAALAESERRRMDALLEAAPVGIVYADAQGKLLVANSENRRIWGAHPLSNTIEEYAEWKGWWADGSEKQGRRLELHEWGLARALRGEEVLRDIIEIEPFGMPGVRRTVLLRATPVRNGAGQITGAAVAQIDITDRVQTEQALRQSEAHLQALLEQSAAGICETDLTGQIVRVNDRFCGIVGRTREDLLALRMQDITHPEDLQRNIPLFKNTVATGEPFEIEKRYMKPDGSAVWVNNTVSLIRASGDESANSILAVTIDISERKQAVEALQQADRRKDEFLAMLAHELRNPLAPIGAAAEILAHADFEPSRIKQTSQVIRRQVKHMTGLVDDLLDVSRVTRGLAVLEKSDVDVKRVIASAVEQVSPLIELKRHHLAIDLPPQTAHVLGDKKRLVQVATNLLNNAAKYTPEGGHIELRMEVQEQRVLLHVKDDGIGIAPDLQPHVFDLFSQASRSADRSQGGLGLGLALVRSLIGLHGGEVACFSEGLGTGSCFTVTLPRLALHTTGEAHPASLHDIRLAQRSLRVLVVDDNADAAQMLATLLEASGHHVLVENSSIKALEAAQTHSPDACILDIGLPDIDGHELAQRLRAQPATARSLLVAVTGYGQEQDRKSALAAGFDHHLVKPVDTKKLAAILAGLSGS